MTINLQTANTDITPEEAGYRQETLDRIDAHLERLVREGKLQCASYSMARNGRTFAVKAMGKLRHKDSDANLLPDSIRRIASITKWFTLAAIMQLMEEGRLHLQQPVKDWLDEFDKPGFRKITIWHLLTHTSGLQPDGGYFTEPYPYGWWNIEFAFQEEPGKGKGEKELTPEERIARRKSQWIRAMLAGPPLCEPGKEWNYSTAGFSLLGEVIERVSGQSCDEYFRDRILTPLGMDRTFFHVPEHLADEVCITDDWGLNKLHDRSARTGEPPRTGGGLYSTLPDLNRFGHAMMDGSYEGKRILSRRSIQLLSRDQFPKGIPAYCWGANHQAYHFGISSSLGFPVDFYSPATYSHEGAGRSALLVDPKERFVVAFFVPTAMDWVPESIINLKNMIWSGLR